MRCSFSCNSIFGTPLVPKEDWNLFPQCFALQLYYQFCISRDQFIPLLILTRASLIQCIWDSIWDIQAFQYLKSEFSKHSIQKYQPGRYVNIAFRPYSTAIVEKSFGGPVRCSGVSWNSFCPSTAFMSWHFYSLAFGTIKLRPSSDVVLLPCRTKFRN